MGSHLPDYKASQFTKLLFLMIKTPRFVVLYRNNRKSSEAHCGQYNQKVATQRDIQCIFQLLHEPVGQKCIEITGRYM
jgi:hypothetical protein